MQATEAAAGTIPATMLRPDYRGRDARRAILLALRQRERDGLRTSMSDLSRILARPISTLQRHVESLRNAGLMSTRRQGTAPGLSLTDAGRLAADTLPAEG